MTANELGLLKLLFGICLFFAIVIDFGLRVRKRNMAEALQFRAQDIWAPLQTSGWNIENLLYGVLQDFSATEIGLIVRDFHDQQVGTITFHTGARKGWITIQTVSELLEADVLPTLLQSITLHPANTARIICAFTRLRGGIYRFDVKGVGVLESKLSNRFQITPWFEYRLNDQPIGGSQRIGRWIDRGSLVVLPNDIPLPIQMFILALQRQRA